jgi:ATP-binding cassette, subfamily C, bacterial
MPYNIRLLGCTLLDFYRTSSWRLPLILLLMLMQSLTAGMGLLFIIPLLQLVGFDTGIASDADIISLANGVFQTLGIALDLKSVLISYIVIVTLIASLHYALSVISTSANQNYICHLRNRLYGSLLQSRWQFIISRKLSDFTHNLTVQVQSVGQATHLLLNLISQMVLCGILTGLAFLLSWEMSLLALAFVCLLLFALLPINKLIYGAGRGEVGNFKRIFQLLTEQLGSLKMIKSYAGEVYHAGQVDEAGEALKAHHVRFARMHALTQWVYMVGAVLGFSAFFYIAQTQLHVPLATTLLLLVIFARLLPQVSQMQRNYQQVLHKIPAIQDVNKLQAACVEHKEMAFGPDTMSPTLKRSIVVDNLGYAYPGRVDIFRNFSVVIESNQSVALVGPSGAGKSTFADLIAGLLVPLSGTIYCDGVPLTGERRVAWRQSVAYVTQEVFLFNHTVRANLSWVADEPDDETLWSALNMAAAAEFVAGLPQGLETVIGDRGVRLSGGERQRLALARAILSKPQLLILDEATSALDNENEVLIQQALKQMHGKLTIVIIAHRETTIRHADKKIVLPGRFSASEGELKEGYCYT